MKMTELFDKYRNECMAALSFRTRRDYLGILVILDERFGNMDHTEVKPRHVADFLNVPTGRVHRNRMVTILSTVFKKARGKWCIDDDMRNPCEGVERWPTAPRERYVTDEEFNAFRAICRPQVQIAMDLALLIGQRQGDIIGMKWAQVKTGAAKYYIEIQQGKTGKKLHIVISPAVEAVLDRAWLLEPHWPREYVIRTCEGQRYTDDGFRSMWQRYCREWERLGRPRFHFHDLRAKCISDNKDFDAAYLLAGHIDQKMTRGTYDRNWREVMPLR